MVKKNYKKCMLYYIYLLFLTYFLLTIILILVTIYVCFNLDTYNVRTRYKTITFLKISNKL